MRDHRQRIYRFAAHQHVHADAIPRNRHRDRYARPENDGVLELTVYVDKETLLQVGSTVKGEDGKLIGEYFFRDIHFNPDFKAEQFTREALK